MNGLRMRRSEFSRCFTGIGVLNKDRLFGKEGTPYDFKGINVQEARDKCIELEQQMKGMKKSINKAVLGMLEVYVSTCSCEVISRSYSCSL